jgi:hypothetical protein
MRPPHDGARGHTQAQPSSTSRIVCSEVRPMVIPVLAVGVVVSSRTHDVGESSEGWLLRGSLPARRGAGRREGSPACRYGSSFRVLACRESDTCRTIRRRRRGAVQRAPVGSLGRSLAELARCPNARASQRPTSNWHHQRRAYLTARAQAFFRRRDRHACLGQEQPFRPHPFATTRCMAADHYSASVKRGVAPRRHGLSCPNGHVEPTSELTPGTDIRAELR